MGCCAGSRVGLSLSAFILSSPSPLTVGSCNILLTLGETQVRFLGREDPLEEGMATHSSILARRIPWTEKPGGATVQGGRKESETTERLTVSLTFPT